jgi:hypothetical protein
MALTTEFKFTNTTQSLTKSLNLFDCKEASYTGRRSTATETLVANNTTGLEGDELVKYRSNRIAQVNTDLKLSKAAVNVTGVSYGVEVHATLVSTDSADPKYRQEMPIVCSLTFRHPLDSKITEAHIKTIMARAVSYMIKEDNTTRISALMGGPITNFSN